MRANLAIMAGDARPNSGAYKVEKYCVHCSKTVKSSVQCKHCVALFHPACLRQAAAAKNPSCVHEIDESVDLTSKDADPEILLLRVLVSELQSKNRVLEENAVLLREKIAFLENIVPTTKINNMSSNPASSGNLASSGLVTWFYGRGRELLNCLTRRLAAILVKCHPYQDLPHGSANRKYLRLYYQNTRGLRTKTEEFYLNVLLEDYDVIAVTESWLNDEIFDGELVDDRYAVLRNDRATSTWGGDFKIPVPNSNSSEKAQALLDFSTFYNLQQFNEILNIRRNSKLDLVLADFNINVQREQRPLVPEDPYHLSLLINCPFDNSIVQDRIQSCFTYEYSKANFLLLYEMIRNIDWSSLHDISDVDTCLDSFYEQLYHCIDQCVPKKEINLSNKPRTFPVWFSHDLIKKVYRKNHLHTLIKGGKACGDQMIEYGEIRSRIKHQTKFEYSQHKSNIERNLNEDPQCFWNFFKSKQASGIPKVMQFNG
ncbi:unnamed protein product [Acanthoscelides obtectus]|uniref:Uncharacterized protein n=1 Tax=Acanthoscelides obtectus TaxID=200917 RepID=A0A9P0JXM4_ACAOB|nr:unnamed protein product [Acanthoscelides obtectus]CAK1663668.1 hypothetical protein AOBTE_LOCUS23788 [Acanthoscelides obtectus]